MNRPTQYICRPLALAVAVTAAAILGAVADAAILLPNGSFEQDRDDNGVADGWRLEIHDGAEGSADITPGRPEYGRAAQHIAHINDAAAWVRVSADNLRAAPETRYRLAGSVKATGRWDVLLYEFKRDGTYLTHRVGGGTTTDWQRIAAIVTTGADAASFKVSLITSGKGEAWFDAFSLSSLEQPPAIGLPTLAAAPVIDGTLETHEWDRSALITDFFLLGAGGESPTAATAVRAALHGSTLFVAWNCDEPRPGDQRISDPATWNDDTVELFLGPPQIDGTYFQFGVTPTGGMLESVKQSAQTGYYVDWYSSATTRQTDRPSMPPWSAAVHRGEDVWTVEMAVDLSGFAESPLPWHLQFARSRKLKPNVEENSSWAYTPGTTFHVPQRFGTVAMPTAAVKIGDLLKPSSVSVPESVHLTPAPKRVVWRPENALTWKSPVAVDAAGNAAGSAAVFQRELQRRFQTDAVVRTGVSDAAALHLLLDESVTDELGEGADKLKVWQQREAYILTVNPDSITIRAQTSRGLQCGIQTLLQMITPQTDPDRLLVPGADIADWPSMQWRGWHLIGPETASTLDEAKRVIDVLAALKMNWVAFQIDNRLQYESHPEVSRSNAPTKDQLRDLVAYAETYGLKVIPMTQCWSHFSYFLAGEQHRNLAEVQNPAANARRKYWNYCPRHPETHPFLFSLIEEQLECFPNASCFHVGLDEITFEAIGVCERCRETDGGELLAEEIGRLHEFLKNKGLRMCMWGDQLLVEHNGGAPYNTAKALPKVPRDIIVFDWHYGRNATFPSVPFFAERGFDVVASGWYEPENVANLAAEAHRNSVLGYGGTTWYAIHRIRDEIRLMPAMPLAAMFTWDTPPQSLAELEAGPDDAFRSIYDGYTVPPEGYRPVDLTPFFNSYLTDSPQRPGWFGTGPENDLSALPTGRQWFAGIPFDIPANGKPQCLILAREGDDADAFPTQLWRLPIRRQVRAVAFLQTCSRPDAFSRHIYDRAKVNPGTVATYVFNYADGEQVTLPLRWNVDIADWNSRLGSARAKTAWTGRTEVGALARVEVLQWDNPRPNAALESIEIISGMTTTRPAVLGMTLVE